MRCSRREFLILSAGTAAAGSALAAALASCGASDPSPITAHDVTLGKLSDFAVGQVRVASDASCAIFRDAGGVWALSLVCTHAGCNIADTGSVSPSSLMCGCHRSQFLANGSVLAGPATQPLPHFAVSIDAASGTITVHVGQNVGADVRAT